MGNEQGVKTFFSGYAEDFDSIYGDGKRRSIFNRIIDKIFRKAMYERYKRTINFITEKNFKSVLDVGCGSGRYSLDLVKKIGLIIKMPENERQKMIQGAPKKMLNQYDELIVLEHYTQTIADLFNFRNP